MKAISKILISSTLIIFLMMNITAQAESIEHTNKLWTQFSLTGPLSNDHRLRFNIEAHARFTEQSNRFDQSILRAQIGYQLKKWMSLWLGYDWAPMLNTGGTDLIHDQAIHQQISLLLIKNDNFLVSSRTRLEQRKRNGETDWAWRLRQKVALVLPGCAIGIFEPIIVNELFFNLNKPSWVADQTIDQNRLFAGFRFPLNKQAIMEIAYLNQYLPLPGPSKMNHILYAAIKVKLDRAPWSQNS